MTENDDEIARLRAEIARLRALLRDTVGYLDPLTYTGEAVYKELGLEIEALDDEDGK